MIFRDADRTLDSWMNRLLFGLENNEIMGEALKKWHRWIIAGRFNQMELRKLSSNFARGSARWQRRPWKRPNVIHTKCLGSSSKSRLCSNHELFLRTRFNFLPIFERKKNQLSFVFSISSSGYVVLVPLSTKVCTMQL